MDHITILTVVGFSVAILWFVDELLSFRNIKKYSIMYNKPPLIAWFLHHHAKRLIYVKAAFYIIFIILAAELIRRYMLYFHLFTFSAIIAYLIYDIKFQRKLF